MVSDYVPVTAAVIRRDGKVLIAKKKKAFMGYLWEFPGGKMEDNETLEECLKRAIHEAFGINVKIGEYLCSTGHAINCQLAIKLYAYEAAYISGDFLLKDHEEIRWVAVEDLNAYDFPEPDRHIVQVLMGKQ